MTGCELRALSGTGSRRLRCDLLVANAGMQPRIGPLATADARLAYCTHTHTFQPAELPDGVFAAGSLTGLRDPRSIEASGRLAGYRAAEWCTGAAPRVAPTLRECESLPGPAPGCDIRHGPAIDRGAKAFVDLDEDGTYKNVMEVGCAGLRRARTREAFSADSGWGRASTESRGRTLPRSWRSCGGDPVEAAVPTTVRPPLVAPTMATLAGPNRDVHKRTPLHGGAGPRGVRSSAGRDHGCAPAISVTDPFACPRCR